VNVHESAKLQPGATRERREKKKEEREKKKQEERRKRGEKRELDDQVEPQVGTDETMAEKKKQKKKKGKRGMRTPNV